MIFLVVQNVECQTLQCLSDTRTEALQRDIDGFNKEGPELAPEIGRWGELVIAE